MLEISAAGVTDTGRVRHRNEDRILFDDRLRVFGVADGVGSMPGGAEAAQAARDAVLAGFGEAPEGTLPDLREIVRRANTAVYELGRTLSPIGIATTLTFGCIRGGRMEIAHLGDSRCYLWSGGRLLRLTEDHNVANEARHGKGIGLPIPPAELKAITRCLGPAAPPNPDIVGRPLAGGDRFLFCTDGVSGDVSDREIAGIVGRPGEPKEIAAALIDLSLRRGGLDNATAVVVSVPDLAG